MIAQGCAYAGVEGRDRGEQPVAGRHLGIAAKHGLRAGPGTAPTFGGLHDTAYRHQWSVGDLVIWDNTGTMHRAMPYNPDSGRLLTRTKLEGEEPFA